jgi:hypothetical protein
MNAAPDPAILSAAIIRLHAEGHPNKARLLLTSVRKNMLTRTLSKALSRNRTRNT